MALTRARPVYGSADGTAALGGMVARDAATAARPGRLVADAVRMRARHRAPQAAARPVRHQARPGRADRPRIRRPYPPAQAPGSASIRISRTRSRSSPRPGLVPPASIRRCACSPGCWSCSAWSRRDGRAAAGTAPLVARGLRLLPTGRAACGARRGAAEGQRAVGGRG